MYQANMLIFLYLFAIGNCEWVEIAQNHYNKDPQHNTSVNLEEITKPTQSYRNNSLIENHRLGVVGRVSNVANIKRVRFPSVKTPSIKPPNLMQESSSVQKEVSYSDNNFMVIEPSVPKINTNGRKTVSNNTENVKPLKLDSNSDMKGATKVNTVNRRRIFKHSKDKENSVPITKPFSDIDEDLFGKLNEGERQYFELISNSDRIQSFGLQDFSNKSLSPTTKTTNFPETKLHQRQTSPDKNREYFDHRSTKNVTSKTNIWLSTPKSSSSEEFYNSVNFITPTSISPIDIIPNNSKRSNFGSVSKISPTPDNPVIQNIENNEDENYTKDISKTTKGHAVNGIWKLMKLVTDTIYKNTHRSFKSKVKYLESLRSTILMSIEDHIDRTWPDDVAGSSRRVRSAQARGHVEFPSSESALMTISFLTFAVFLIKLVLQVIHTYKNKTMMVTPTIVAAVGRAAAALKSQK